MRMPTMIVAQLRSLGLGLALSFVFVSLTFGYTNENRLCWTPNQEPDLAGYKVYIVGVSGERSAFVTTKDIPKAQATSGPSGDPHACTGGKIGISVGTLGLPNAPTYYGVLKAYNALGADSAGWSNEVSLSPLANPPADVTGVEVN